MMPSDDDFDSDFESGDERDPLSRDNDGKLIRGVVTRPPAWDSFRHLPPETETETEEGESLYKAIIKFIKLLAYTLTFIIVLSGAVFAKGSLLLMTSQLQPDRALRYCNKNFGKDRNFAAHTPDIERVSWYWVIFFAFCVPELGTLVRSLRIGFFKGWNKPHFIEFVIPWFFETCYALGLGLFVFVTLPSVDVIKGVMLTNCLCVIPALLGLLGKQKRDKDGKLEKEKSILKAVLNSSVTIFQISGLLLWPLLSWDTFPNPWALPLSAILISMGWWENYVDKASPSGFIRYLAEKRKRMRDTRYYSYAYISVWKMAVFFGTMILSVWIVGRDVEILFTEFIKSFQQHDIPVSEIRPSVLTTPSSTSSDSSLYPARFVVPSHYGAVQWALYIQILTAYLCYVFGKFACKVCIQGFSFAFPVSLAVPATLVALISLCGMRSDDTCLWKSTMPGYLFFTCPEGDFLENFVTKEYAWVWLFWLFSQAWITRHIWKPSPDRLLSTEKLMVTPMYCSLMIDQSLAMNRIRDNSRDIYMSAPDEENDDEQDDPLAFETATSGTDTYDADAFPHIIACATMWHENKEEMMEMLKSIFRMDIDQCARRIFKNTFGVQGQGYYEFETHIFFDDAFELRDEEEDSPVIVNPFVKLVVETVEEAACHVHETIITIRPPTRIPTPYGGRLEWTLPGKTKLICHLKNKDLIRHKKRWSQIMYMYYLLGFKLMELPIPASRKDVIAENTYLLALDGDIDFQPNAVELLVDLMKKNKNLGAACGRIHPIGAGPMVWYQKFEYAIGHWLQKATEHVIGCVLCSPGCFSLFRAKALMEDNVMKKYTTMSEEPRHFVQYDQGEDRWLCTLLLQRGYRVEYSAASDAKTHAPEGFNEFYNQRRRWVPSTMANIFDLLMDSKQTIKNNPDISKPYIFYQILMMGGSILGPGTIFLMLVGAFVAAFNGIDNVTSLTFNSIPILIYLFVCYFFKSDVQLMFAQILSAIYALVMVAVLVALSLQIAEDGLLAPSSIFLIAVALSFIISALLHPMEFDCLVHGIVYYITIPSMYLLLIIYSLFNLNNVSWGTREVAKKRSAAEIKAELEAAEEEKKKAKKSGLLGILPKGKEGSEGSIEFSLAGLFKIMCCVRPKPVDKQQQLGRIVNALDEISKRLSEIEQNIDVPGRRDSQLSRKSVVGSSAPNINSKRNSKGIETIVEAVEDAGETSSTHSDKPTEPKRDPLINPYWLDDKDLLRGNVDFLSGTEITFWNGLIAKYLFPIAADKKKEAKLQAELIDLRNQSVFAFFMINAVFVLAIFLLQLNKDILFIEWPLGVKVNMTIENPGSSEIILQKTYLQLEPIGLVFVAFFALILGVQFVAMLIHRFGTLSHLLAATPLISQESAFEVRGVHEIKKMQKLKSPDAEDKKGAKKSIDPGRRKTIHNLEKQRDKPEIATMDRQFKKKFREFEETVDKDPKLRGSRFRTTFQELQRRRSTHVQNKRNSIMEFRKSKIAQMNEPNSQPSQFGSRLAPADAASAVFQNYNRGGGIPNPAFIPDSTGNWTAGMPRPDYDVDSASSSGSNSGLRRPILAYPSRFRKRE